MKRSTPGPRPGPRTTDPLSLGPVAGAAKEACLGKGVDGKVMIIDNV